MEIFRSTLNLAKSAAIWRSLQNSLPSAPLVYFYLYEHSNINLNRKTFAPTEEHTPNNKIPTENIKGPFKDTQLTPLEEYLMIQAVDFL